MVAGCFWRVIDHSLDVAGFYYSSRTFKMDLVLAEGKRRGMIPKSTTSTATTDLDMQIAKLDTLLVLLDAVYNDGAGPVAYLMSNTAPMMLDLVNSPISATQIPTTSSGSPTGTNSSGIGSSSSSGGVSVHHQQHQIESCAREMAEKAEEIIKSNGIQWHLSRASGRFEIINGHQVFEEVKQKITELVVI